MADENIVDLTDEDFLMPPEIRDRFFCRRNLVCFEACSVCEVCGDCDMCVAFGQPDRCQECTRY